MKILMKPMICAVVIGAAGISPAAANAGDEKVPVPELTAEKKDLAELLKSLEGSEWQLEDLAGKGVIDRALATIGFMEEMKIGGRGTVNRFSAVVAVEEGKPKLGPIVSTRMAGVPAAMDQEQRYFAALEKMTGLRVEEPFLYIDVEGEEKPLKFIRMEKPEEK